MKYIYKIRHKATGKFVRIKLEQQGIDVWASNPLTMYSQVAEWYTHIGR
jgi:hypothetical protein